MTVVLLLFRDWLTTYGDDYKDRREGQMEKVAARFVATAITSIGAALLIISAVYHLHGDPVIVIKAPPKDLIFKVSGSKERLDGKALIEYLNSTYDNLQRIDAEIGAMWYPDLVIVNCGRA